MKQEEFLQRLNEVAVLKQIKVPKSAGIREADTACDIFRNGQQLIIDKDNNSTLNYKIVRLKYQETACLDCGRLVQGQERTKTLYTFPQKHWREHCRNCNKIRDPETKQFDLMPAQAPNRFAAVLKKIT